MADFAIYWRNYVSDLGEFRFHAAEPLHDWRTNLNRFQVGDRLWFVTAGESCGGTVPTGGYLVNGFIVGRVVPNIGDDGEYPPDDYKFTIWATDGRAAFFDPPVDVDSFLRGRHPVTTHIGTLLQSPKRLGDDLVARFMQLSGNHPALSDDTLG